MSNDLSKGFGGYVVGRWLWVDDDKTRTASKKDFSYYPEKKGGRPPYWFKTRREAEEYLKKLRAKRAFPSMEDNVKIVQLNTRTYLDRY